MSVMEKRFIDVLNCDDNIVAVRGLNNRGYLFEPGTLEDPFVIPIEPADIKYIHSGSRAFRNGVLRFRAEEQDEIYEALGIAQEQPLFTEQIEDILLNPTAGTLTRLVEIASSGEFERVRRCYYYLVNSGKDISNKVRVLIEKRYEELRAGRLHTALSVTPAADKETDAAREIQGLRAELAEYKDLVQSLLKKMNTTSDIPAEDSQVVKRPRAKKAAAQQDAPTV